ncbi:TrbG/VirB9 family P-type conjugative transfer protein [Sphingomonas sp. Leaf4]|uniref:TrbG/VirB9 family P-type conjugative transfer protein n=1 Tax=Sphingomonas sp. Leaf4 TaxID=2876553 RepID=UPI001E3A45B3|nr:TrbG/VirB9 family P-type conjugative transfer protein [Sphingomonas sp. Leaf4]
MIGPALLCAVMAMLQATASSQDAPPPDPHIQTLPYTDSGVVDLRVSDGFAAVVEFAPDERVETVVVGNDTGWEVGPNRLGNRVVVKPLPAASATNMVVVTDRRRYVFLLAADRSSDVYVLRFSYPQAAEAEVTTIGYRLRGDKDLFPVAMGDNGRRTTIRWADTDSLPAIFADDGHGQDALVNGRMVDNAYVIEGTARRYVFRRGKRRAIAVRLPGKLPS